MGKVKGNKGSQRELLGRKVMCIGLGGALYQCQNPNCLIVKKKGMFLEYQGNIYCSERCIKKVMQESL